ncbi:MAG: glycosyltransferase family 4 protein [Prevotellaceae bacterium]|jgi:glycosyltransferase involved in cell wall biosynthesis|nr:glycosyltransferase family 4 protein [Prevotellaceae bacterium]
MKILFIVPGSGDPFYCGNCFRDNLHANALRSAGHDVVVMPLYLPLTHESFEGNTPLFFPATTFYVAEKFFRRRQMPRWLAKMLGAKAMLRLAASFSGSTSAGGMEGITLAMVKGEGAAFRNQVAPLVSWIKDHEKPDVVHLSSTLIAGVAKAVKQQAAIPVVCSLQDEEVWIDNLKKEYADAAWKGIADNLKYIDKLIASSEFYKKAAQRRIPQITDVEVIYPGVNREKYAAARPPQRPTIGFFYRMNRENGLHILAEAFVELKKRGTVKDLKLKVGGGYTSADRKFLKQVRQTLAPCMGDVSWSDTYSLSDHAGFYREVSVICVPITFNEGVGLYLCEAFAAGCPAVEPATGSFAEVVGNAGITYFPNSSEALADALERLLTNEQLLSLSRANALRLSEVRYNREASAKKLIEAYRALSVEN